jgi:hypothetical protein
MRFFSIFLILLISCNENKQEKNESPEKSRLLFHDAPDLSLNYPSEWELTVDTGEIEVLHISRHEKDNLYGYDISISYYEMDELFEDFVKMQEEDMKDEYGFSVLKKEKISFDSKEAYKFLSEFPTDYGKNESAEIYYIKGEEKYYLIFNAGSSLYRQEANTIIQSIRFKN